MMAFSETDFQIDKRTPAHGDVSADKGTLTLIKQ